MATTKRLEWWFSLAIAVIGVMGIAYLVLLDGERPWRSAKTPATASPPPPTRTADPIERARFLDQIQSSGVIVKRTCLEYEAHVNPRAWLALSSDRQRTVARALALWCEDQGRERRMKIIDEENGRTFAEVHFGEYRAH